MKLFYAVVSGVILAVAMAGVAESQCPGGVCPTQQPWQQAQQQARPFVCRLVNRTSRQQVIGTGTLVSKGRDYGVVVTCAHLYDEGTGALTARFPDGTTHAAAVVAKSRVDDLSFLKVTGRPKAPIAKIATDFARQGERISHAGYGKTGQYREVSGTVRGYLKWGGATKVEVMDVTGGCREGDSGGPILNARGELVGVLATTDGRSTQGIFNGRLCAFAMENRYLFPWNADLAGKKDKNKLEGNRPVAQPPLPQQAPVDLTAVNERLGNLESQQAEQLKLIDANTNRLVPLEQTADRARQLSEQWPALQAALQNLERTSATTAGQANQAASDASKAVDAVTGVAGKAAEAVEAAAGTKAELDAALDADVPTSRLGKLKAGLEEKLQSTVTGKVVAAIAEKTGFPIGAIGGGAGILALVLILLIRKDIKDKIETGDPLLIEKIAARTRNEVDDRIAAKIGERLVTHASPDHGWREEMADIKGMFGELRDKLASKTK